MCDCGICFCILCIFDIECFEYCVMFCICSGISLFCVLCLYICKFSQMYIYSICMHSNYQYHQPLQLIKRYHKWMLLTQIIIKISVYIQKTCSSKILIINIWKYCLYVCPFFYWKLPMLLTIKINPTVWQVDALTQLITWIIIYIFSQDVF